MIRYWGLILFICSLSFHVAAQKEVDFDGEPNFFDRVYTAGGFSMQLGDITYIELSPAAGYMVNNMFSVGLGFTYRYLKIKYYNFDTSIYGYRLFARHNLSHQFFLYAEYENLQNEVFYADGSQREWVDGVFGGGGLQQPIGKKASFVVMGLYNFAYDPIRSPYNSPWVFRVGFTL